MHHVKSLERKINYPKLKKQKSAVNIEGLPEPVRETLYDVIKKNFKTADRGTYLHRIIYAGRHNLMQDQDILCNIFSDIIDQVNGEYHLETLSGFLLTYTKCFVHMVEGDEDSINKHLKLLLENKEYMENLGPMKLLLCVHHINQRFHPSWTTYSGRPSKLYADINANSTLEDTGRYIYNCIKKMYKLVRAYHDGSVERSVVEMSASSSEQESRDKDDARSYHRMQSSSITLSHVSHLSNRDDVSALFTAAIIMDPYRNILPEYELVRFIINSTYTQTIQSYYQLYRTVPQRDIYKDRVWPIPGDFVPMDVFYKPYDSVIELHHHHHSRHHASVVEGHMRIKRHDEKPTGN